MLSTLSYLNCIIEVELPDDPSEDNTVKVCIRQAEGTYDPDLYNDYLIDWQFGAENVDPNQWIFEALSYAISFITKRVLNYAQISAPSKLEADQVQQPETEKYSELEDIDIIPF